MYICVRRVSLQAVAAGLKVVVQACLDQQLKLYLDKQAGLFVEATQPDCQNQKATNWSSAVAACCHKLQNQRATRLVTLLLQLGGHELQ